jgi:FeS assembly SUF system protein
MIEKTDNNKPIFSEEFNIDGTFTIKKEDIVNQMKEVFDPEIPVNIYDLGLIYEIKIDEEKKVEVIMTLTSPNCPVAESLPKEVSQKIKSLKGMKSLAVYLTFDPPWDQNMMSEDAKLALDVA